MDLKQAAKISLACLDLTSLNDTDTKETIETLCEKAISSNGTVAALCVYKEHLDTCVKYFGNNAKRPNFATVVNFPNGDSNLDSVLQEITYSIEHKADEIDLVLNYKLLVADASNADKVQDFVQKCKNHMNTLNSSTKLKVIIESGVLEQHNIDLVRVATKLCLAVQVDFVKTSTGKVKTNATLSAAQVMLEEISKAKYTVGFKAAGGIRSVEDAKAFLSLGAELCTKDFLAPSTFRFGASSLLNAIIDVLEDKVSKPDESAVY